MMTYILLIVLVFADGTTLTAESMFTADEYRGASCKQHAEQTAAEMHAKHAWWACISQQAA